MQEPRRRGWPTRPAAISAAIRRRVDRQGGPRSRWGRVEGRQQGRRAGEARARRDVRARNVVPRASSRLPPVHAAMPPGRCPSSAGRGTEMSTVPVANTFPVTACLPSRGRATPAWSSPEWQVADRGAAVRAGTPIGPDGTGRDYGTGRALVRVPWYGRRHRSGVPAGAGATRRRRPRCPRAPLAVVRTGWPRREPPAWVAVRRDPPGGGDRR